MNNPDLKISMINSDILNLTWPALSDDSTNEDFWKLQWKKHGTYTYLLPGSDSIQIYFENGRWLFAKLDLNTSIDPKRKNIALRPNPQEKVNFCPHTRKSQVRS